MRKGRIACGRRCFALLLVTLLLVSGCGQAGGGPAADAGAQAGNEQAEAPGEGTEAGADPGAAAVSGGTADAASGTAAEKTGAGEATETLPDGWEAAPEDAPEL